MQNLPFQKEISEPRAVFSKFGMHVKLVRNTREGMQLRRNFGVAQELQEVDAALRRDIHVRQAVI